MLKQDSYLLLYIKEAIGFAQVRRICRLRAAGAKGIFSFAKENIPFGTPRERALIGSFGLERLLCLRNGNACARRCRVRTARRFASASIIRCCAAVGGSAALRMRHTPCGCRSASLVAVQSNFRLPPVSSMRRAPAMPLFRTQSAAVLSSLAPHDSKARLQDVTICRRFMAKPCTPHLHCAARAALRATNWQCRGSRGPPLVLSLGGVRGIFSF